MHSASEIVAIILILLNFRLIGSSRVGSSINVLAAQALVLNALPVLSQKPMSLWMMAMVASATIIKAWFLPAMLRRAMQKTNVIREVEPLIGYTPSVIIGTIMLALCSLAARTLKLPLSDEGLLLLPVTLFTILTGAFLLVSRRKAIMQVLGFLVLENGVYLFGVTFAINEPVLVQAGVMLDVFAAVFVMGIIIYHINREFDHIDIDRLSNLKD